MKLTKTCLVLFALASLIIVQVVQVVLAQQGGETPAEQIILAYIKARGLNIQPATEEYERLMRGILLGEHPGLTGRDSVFIENRAEWNDVIAYAAQYVAIGSTAGVERAVEEARLPPAAAAQQSQGEAGRLNAIAYAYKWSKAGTNTHHNPDYPDFGLDDCTNFVSQAMQAGGFREIGSGDGCTHEETSVEWYVEANPSPPLWCLGNFRDWEWSTSWSVPWPFRDYFAYQNRYAAVPGWTTDVFTAKYYLSPGDVVQLQVPNGEDWLTYHTMIVTMEDENDLYVTYHSNALGLDEVDKPLSSIPAGPSQRYVLVKINFPAQVYLPLVMKRWPPIPDTPVLNPINNPNGSSSYTVSWQPAYLASTYTLQEATDVNFSTGVVTYYPGSATSRSVTGKTAGTYYYRVKAINSWGDSGWSNVEQTTVWPTTRTFYSVADTMVQSGYPTTNYGNSSIMRAGYYTGTRVMQSLARFDLSGIPAGMPIGQARLYLYLGSSQDSPGDSRVIAVYRVTSSWTEGSVTWSTKPGLSDMYYGLISIPHADYRWYSVDVTTLVREWVNGQYTNYGVWILGNESPSNPNWRGFYTREDSGGRRPYLYITYGTGASSAQTGEGTFISPLPTPGSPSALPETFRSLVLIPEP